MWARLLFIVIVFLGMARVVSVADGTGFTALDLKTVCSLALARNPSIASADAAVAQSVASVKSYRSSLLPSVGLRSSYGYLNKATLFGTTPILENNTVINRVELEQAIYTGGRAQAMVEAAKWGYRTKLHTRSAIADEVLVNAAIAYFRARQAQEAVSIAQSSVTHLESSYNAAQKLFDAGVVTKSDVLRAEVALAIAKEQSIRAANDFATAIASLKTAIGLPQAINVALASETSGDDLSAYVDLPARSRTELQAAEAAVMAADSQLKAAQGAAKPAVLLVADFQNQPVGAQFPRLNNTFQIGLMARFDLFEGGRNKAAIEEARASLAKTRAELEHVKRSIELQVEAAKLAVASARARTEAMSAQVRSAEESFRVIETGYKEGINVLTDLLSAESMLTAAKGYKLTAEYDLKVAQTNLLLALGQADLLVKGGSR